MRAAGRAASPPPASPCCSQAAARAAGRAASPSHASRCRSLAAARAPIARGLRSRSPRPPCASSCRARRARTRATSPRRVGDRCGRSPTLASPGTEVALAGTVFTPGANRVAFGVVHPEAGFVYGKTAVYVADSPDGKARGPFPAPADLLVTDPAYRSRTAATGDDVFAAVYEAFVPFDAAGQPVDPRPHAGGAASSPARRHSSRSRRPLATASRARASGRPRSTPTPWRPRPATSRRSRRGCPPTTCTTSPSPT